MNKAIFDAIRFLEAQENVYAEVVDELSSGHKRSHWIWFILSQLAALGRSLTTRFYGLESAADARAFHEHPVLGAPDEPTLELLSSSRRAKQSAISSGASWLARWRHVGHPAPATLVVLSSPKWLQRVCHRSAPIPLIEQSRGNVADWVS
jgi:hypothetical protein